MKLLKTNQKGTWGQRIGLPIMGEVEVNEHGQVEVTEEVADLLLQSGDWSDVSETEEEDDTDEVDDETAEDDSDDAEDAETEDTTKVVEKKPKVAETTKKVAKTAETKPKAEVKTEPVVKDAAETALILEALENMNLREMINMAKEANMKGYQLFSKDADKMRAFMKKKLQ